MEKFHVDTVVTVSLERFTGKFEKEAFCVSDHDVGFKENKIRESGLEDKK